MKIVRKDKDGFIMSCEECGKEDEDVIIELGERISYESATTWICLSCIKKLNTLIQTENLG